MKASLNEQRNEIQIQYQICVSLFVFINTAISRLDIIHRPNVYLKHDVSETEPFLSSEVNGHVFWSHPWSCPLSAGTEQALSIGNNKGIFI
jgi:hypothetical protein